MSSVTSQFSASLSTLILNSSLKNLFGARPEETKRESIGKFYELTKHVFDRSVRNLSDEKIYDMIKNLKRKNLSKKLALEFLLENRLIVAIGISIQYLDEDLGEDLSSILSSFNAIPIPENRRISQTARKIIFAEVQRQFLLSIHWCFGADPSEKKEESQPAASSSSAAPENPDLKEVPHPLPRSSLPPKKRQKMAPQISKEEKKENQPAANSSSGAQENPEDLKKVQHPLLRSSLPPKKRQKQTLCDHQ